MAEQGNVKIVWQNENWVVVDKPCEWLCVPSRQGKADLRPCLGHDLQDLMGRQIWPVHRLDFEVSGLVLFALNAQCHQRASSWFESRDVRKVYEAWSLGRGTFELGTAHLWRSQLVRGKRRTFAAPHGAPAETRAQLIKPLPEIPDAFCWSLEPFTGRAHQLRYEMSAHGVAIVGDVLYGGPKWNQKGIALRAVELDFEQVSLAERKGLPGQMRIDGLQALDVVIEQAATTKS